MMIGNMLYDREPQSCPFFCPAAAFIDSVETFKNSWNIIFWDSYPCIGNSECFPLYKDIYINIILSGCWTVVVRMLLIPSFSQSYTQINP